MENENKGLTIESQEKKSSSELHQFYQNIKSDKGKAVRDLLEK